MMRANAPHRILLLGVSLLFVSCTGVGSWIRRPDCLVVPVTTEDLPNNLDVRARMHFSMRGQEARFEVIARGAPEELVVVGIAQYGVRLFAVRQRGREIALEGAPTRESAHLARWTMDALHRALWISGRSDAGATPVVNWNWESESVMESVNGGRREREFARPGALEPVVIRYVPGSAEAGDRIEIQNPWCGYEATLVVIDTPEQAVK